MALKSKMLAAAGFGIAALVSPHVTGQDASAIAAAGPVSDPSTWQVIVSGQIEALRSADGAAALSYAGQGFQASGTTPQMFLAWVAQSGYGPIIESERHRFDAFQVVSEQQVLQHVTIVGHDLRMFSATYQLLAEDDGWRVQGVVLEDRNALAI